MSDWMNTPRIKAHDMMTDHPGFRLGWDWRDGTARIVRYSGVNDLDVVLLFECAPFKPGALRSDNGIIEDIWGFATFYSESRVPDDHSAFPNEEARRWVFTHQGGVWLDLVPDEDDYEDESNYDDNFSDVGGE